MDIDESKPLRLLYRVDKSEKFDSQGEQMVNYLFLQCFVKKYDPKGNPNLLNRHYVLHSQNTFMMLCEYSIKQNSFLTISTRLGAYKNGQRVGTAVKNTFATSYQFNDDTQ